MALADAYLFTDNDPKDTILGDALAWQIYARDKPVQIEGSFASMLLEKHRKIIEGYFA